METFERLDKPWLNVCEGSCAVIDWSWESTGYVYFIVTEDARLVKIGWSVDPHRRRTNMQPGSSHKLRVAASFVGTKEDEARLQGMLGYVKHRSRSEWFLMTCEIGELVRQLGGETSCGEHQPSLVKSVASRFAWAIERPNYKEHGAELARGLMERL